MSNPELNVYQRMNAVMSEVAGVAKKQLHKHHNFQFASHDDVTEAIRAAMVRYGIVQRASMLSWGRDVTTQMVWVHVRVEWVNMDKPDDRVVAEVFSESQTGGKGGPSPQQIGAAFSYGVKLLQLKNFALVGGNEEDSDQAQGPVTPYTAPVVQEGSFEYYAMGFDRVQNMEQLDALMNEIANNRYKFVGTPALTQFGDLSDKARARLSGGTK